MEFCSPSALDRKNNCCFSRKSLNTIIKAWNTLMYHDKIIIPKKYRNNIHKIVENIDSMFHKYINKQNTYWAWAEIIKQMAR